MRIGSGDKHPRFNRGQFIKSNRKYPRFTGGIDPGEQMVISDLSAPVAGMPLRTADDTTGQAAARQTARQESQS